METVTESFQVNSLDVDLRSFQLKVKDDTPERKIALSARDITYLENGVRVPLVQKLVLTIDVGQAVSVEITKYVGDPRA